MRSNIELNYLAISFRKQYQEDEYSYIDIFRIASRINNLSIVLYPFSDHVSGMCVKQYKSNIIAINSTMSYGRQRLTLAHELYHLFYDDSTGTTISNINYQNSNTIEQEANIFASYLLAPYNSFKDELHSMNNEINEYNLVNLGQHFGMSHQAVLIRLLQDDIIDSKTYNKYQNINLHATANLLGYDNSLYEPNTQDNLYFTTGNYIYLCNKLKDQELITSGKYNELLTQAFRQDLIYDKSYIEAIND